MSKNSQSSMSSNDEGPDPMDLDPPLTKGADGALSLRSDSPHYQYTSSEDATQIPWIFSQIKGTMDDDITDADIISVVEFNSTGEYLATGDKGGRVVIFKRHQKKNSPILCDYNVYCTFQSHEAEFDYLKSLEIEEKINKIKWIRQPNSSLYLLTTNDKTIKLWKIAERRPRTRNLNLVSDDGNSRPFSKFLKVPCVDKDFTVEAIPRRIFANAHTYHINSISVNSDDETFLSADDLRVNVWNLNCTDQSFNVVDIKPANMEDLSEVITSAQFHPTNCHEFIYSSSTGAIRLCDMRSRALCDQHAKWFQENEDPANKSFFSEVIVSISDMHFNSSGRYILSRDYLNVKVWDVNMESHPVCTFPVHDHLKARLCSLYENDCIFDKFECRWGGASKGIMTGSYHNFFRVYDFQSRAEVCYEASKNTQHLGHILQPKTVTGSRRVRRDGLEFDTSNEVPLETLDFNRKILHASWHPEENILAIAATNNLFLFQQELLDS